eukprot:gene6782-4864_t
MGYEGARAATEDTRASEVPGLQRHDRPPPPTHLSLSLSIDGWMDRRVVVPCGAAVAHLRALACLVASTCCAGWWAWAGGSAGSAAWAWGFGAGRVLRVGLALGPRRDAVDGLAVLLDELAGHGGGRESAEVVLCAGGAGGRSGEERAGEWEMHGHRGHSPRMRRTHHGAGREGTGYAEAPQRRSISFFVCFIAAAPQEWDTRGPVQRRNPDKDIPRMSR